MNRKVKSILGISIIASMLLVACEEENHDNELKIPTSASEYSDAYYQDVLTELEMAGFTNIELQEIDDLITGWLTKEGEIERVSINGDTEFTGGSYYPKDAKVVISYHVFPENEEGEEEQQTTETKEEQVTTNNEETTTDTHENITIENNETFAAIMIDQSGDSTKILNFVEQNKGEIIEFEGHISHMMYHGDYETRYDVLINSGDFEKTTEIGTQWGPNLKFEDVSAFDMNPTNTDTIKMGQNMHIVAKIEEFNPDIGIIFLDPVSLTLR